MDPEMQTIIRQMRIKRMNTLKEAIKNINDQPIPNDTLAMQLCDEYEDLSGKVEHPSRDR